MAESSSYRNTGEQIIIPNAIEHLPLESVPYLSISEQNIGL
jgi:hypothetical protein